MKLEWEIYKISMCINFDGVLELPVSKFQRLLLIRTEISLSNLHIKKSQT